eukprot:c44383_g1_i1 orf=3-566(-)
MFPSQRREFPAFPFEPYPIQVELMTAVYTALQKGGVAVVESPTGTGKTLSLICSVLQWLQDERSSSKSDPSEEADSPKDAMESEDEPAWMRDFAEKKELQSKKQNILATDRSNFPQPHVSNRKKSDKVGKFFFAEKTEEDNFTNKKKDGHHAPRIPCDAVDDEDNYLLDEYDSSDDCVPCDSGKRKNS